MQHIDEEFVKSIYTKWREKVGYLILDNERYKNSELVSNMLAVANEAFNAELQIYKDFSEKILALFELEERKKYENGDISIN